MNWLLLKLERIVRPIAVPNLTEIFIACQAGMFLASRTDSFDITRLPLIWERVFAGEYWRLGTFIVYPPNVDFIFIIFYLYLFYFMGRSLEYAWGTVRYNLYFMLGLVVSALSGLIVQDAVITGTFFQATVFLAFATLNPDFEIRLMFILPVKIKYLAAISMLFVAVRILFGSAGETITGLAAISNYLLFFAPEHIKQFRNVQRRAKFAGLNARERSILRGKTAQVRHQCRLCEKNDVTHPNEEFRYCSKCKDTPAYCQECLNNHVCVTDESE
ncbi:MAG: hypothetical protein AAF664_16090 [Planctomycetota bacterium]